MRRANQKKALLDIRFTSSQACRPGTEMDAYKVGHTSQMPCVCVIGGEGGQRLPECRNTSATVALYYLSSALISAD